jgi:hypothetical protein
MKTFNEYLEESKDSVESLKKILKRTSKSMTTHANGGGRPHTQRGSILTSKYDSTTRKLKDLSYQHWLDYCSEMDYDKSHDGLDHYA